MAIDQTTKTIAKLVVLVVIGLALVVAATLTAIFVRPANSPEVVNAIDVGQLDVSQLDALIQRQALLGPQIVELENATGESQAYLRDSADDGQPSEVVLDAGDYEQWEAGEADSPFPEETRAEVRAMKKIGLHCVLVEHVPLFDDFRMPTDEGNAFVKDTVQRRADEIAGWLDGTETQQELNDMIWGGDPDGDQDSLRSWCLAEPRIRL